MSVAHLDRLIPGELDLWVGCHGFESRSVQHLVDGDSAKIAARHSFGFPYPSVGDDSEVSRRLAERVGKLGESGFDISIVDDVGFEAELRQLLSQRSNRSPVKIAADVSSMSRGRIASLLVVCADVGASQGCRLDLVYYPSSYASHKHSFEPLEHFGPVHSRLSGWPGEADLPISLVLGLGTEPRRADGVAEMLEPDILALYVPVGDEREFSDELVRENRRLLNVGGEPIAYLLRDPVSTFDSIVVTCSALSSRSRVVVVPLGPKLFTALAVLAALSIGQDIGVWKASPGQNVDPIDVLAGGTSILIRVTFALAAQCHA